MFLGVPLLKVDELIWGCYGITFRKLEIELADVNRSLLDKSSGLNVHFAQGPANSADHRLAYETIQTRQHD